MIVEGVRELTRVADASHPVTDLYLCDEFFAGPEVHRLVRRLRQNRDITLLQCTKSVFQRMSYRDSPDGVLAVVPHPTKSLDDLKVCDDSWFVVAANLEKPGNLGAILRSADAVGLSGVIVADGTTEISNPNVVRSSVGTLFSVPVVQTSSGQTITWIRDNKITMIATSPTASVDYLSLNLTHRIAIVVGGETAGLGEEWTRAADRIVSLPALGLGGLRQCSDGGNGHHVRVTPTATIALDGLSIQ